jgi:hypothetical protein
LTSNPEKPSINQPTNQIRAQNRQLPHKPSTISKRKPTRASGYQGRNQQTAEGNKSDKARQQAQLASTSSSRAPTSPPPQSTAQIHKEKKNNLFSPVQKKWNYFSTHETISKQQERRRGVRGPYRGANKRTVAGSDRKEGTSPGQWPYRGESQRGG